jgi:hypothetical protein
MHYFLLVGGIIIVSTVHQLYLILKIKRKYKRKYILLFLLLQNPGTLNPGNAKFM